MAAVKSVFHGIRGRLIVLVVLPIVFFTGLSLDSIRALSIQEEQANLIAKDRMPKMESILLSRVHANALMRFLWTAAAVQDEKIREEKIKEVDARYVSLQKEIQHFSSFHLSEKMQKDFAMVPKDVAALETPMKKSLELLRIHSEESDKQARLVIFQEMVPKVNEVTHSIEACTDLLAAQVKEEIAAADSASTFGQRSVVWLSLLGGVFLLAYGFWISSRLVNSLSGIADTIVGIQKKVTTTSQGLSSASHQASAGSTQAASALEETVASIEELTSMVKINADHSKSASGLSLASIGSAQNGEMEIRHLIESMHEISAGSKKIEEIINVIDDIAFQTNLLALNASVEAARAGEHGRGFAVVAEAVRTLSQRSAAAAKDIHQLIQENVETVVKGAAIADRSEELLQNIVHSVKKVADLNAEIAAASGEQAEGITQITKAMNELDSSVQQNAQASEGVAQSSEDMAHQAEILQESISQLEKLVRGAA